jgi:hypothetical protein
MARHLDFVDLTPDEILNGLAQCKKAGVRGAAIHDYMHALAAKKSGAKELLTLDQNDFDGLVAGLTVSQV